MTVWENSSAWTSSSRSLFATALNGCLLRSSFTLGLFPGSLLSISLTVSRSSRPYLAASRGLYAPLRILQMSSFKLAPSKGWVSAHISYSTHPALHTSDLWSYGLFSQISGER